MKEKIKDILFVLGVFGVIFLILLEFSVTIISSYQNCTEYFSKLFCVTHIESWPTQKAIK